MNKIAHLRGTGKCGSRECFSGCLVRKNGRDLEPVVSSGGFYLHRPHASWRSNMAAVESIVVVQWETPFYRPRVFGTLTREYSQQATRSPTIVLLIGEENRFGWLVVALASRGHQFYNSFLGGLPRVLLKSFQNSGSEMIQDLGDDHRDFLPCPKIFFRQRSSTIARNRV